MVRHYMLSFPFTQKKLLSLPPARRHKRITDWLKRIYLDLLAGKLSKASLDLIYQNLRQLHDWLSIDQVSPTQPDTPQKWIELLSDTFHMHQRLTGLGIAEPDLLPHITTGDRTADGPWQAAVPYQVALDNLRSAFNVGSIFRLVDAAGFECVIMGADTPDTANRQVARTAMGATEWIPGRKADHLAGDLERLKSAGYVVIGIETVAGNASYHSFSWPRRGIVVLGNEEYGISQDVLRCCDHFVHIPMAGFKNSINVASAFAVIAFHIRSVQGAVADRRK